MDRREDSELKVSGWIHLAVLYVFCLTIMSIAFIFLNSVGIELVIVPVISIFIANLVEYMVHRYPMHRPTFLSGLYKQHAGIHHRYFTHDHMEIQNSIDLREALTNVRAIFFLMLFVVAPMTTIFSVIFGLNSGMLFIISSMAYLMIFEFTHLVSHLPLDHFLLKIHYFKDAMERHRTHHNTRLMKDWNFNVSFPIWDKLLGTLK